AAYPEALSGPIKMLWVDPGRLIAGMERVPETAKLSLVLSTVDMALFAALHTMVNFRSGESAIRPGCAIWLLTPLVKRVNPSVAAFTMFSTGVPPPPAAGCSGFDTNTRNVNP